VKAATRLLHHRLAREVRGSSVKRMVLRLDDSDTRALLPESGQARAELPDGTESEGERPRRTSEVVGEREIGGRGVMRPLRLGRHPERSTSYPQLRTRAQARSNNVANCV
jgi:hypothetical protein